LGRSLVDEIGNGKRSEHYPYYYPIPFPLPNSLFLRHIALRPRPRHSTCLWSRWLLSTYRIMSTLTPGHSRWSCAMLKSPTIRSIALTTIFRHRQVHAAGVDQVQRIAIPANLLFIPVS
jgi:hypothetical protein